MRLKRICLVWSNQGFVEDVDVYSDPLFDGDDAANLADGFNYFSGLANDPPHVFGVDFNGQGYQAVGFFFTDDNVFGVIDDIGDDVLKKLLHLDLLTNDKMVLVG